MEEMASGCLGSDRSPNIPNDNDNNIEHKKKTL